MTKMTATPKGTINETDLYTVLGVETDASPEEIRTAYQRGASRYHPDKANGDEGIFKKIKLAYEVLIDSVKRQVYDGTGLYDWSNEKGVNEAKTLIETIIMGILNNPELEIERLDMVFHITDGLEKSIMTCRAGVRHIEKQLKRLKKNRKRAKSAIIRTVFDKKIADLERGKKITEDDVKLYELALRIGKSCRYEFDVEPEVKIQQYGPSGGVSYDPYRVS